MVLILICHFGWGRLGGGVGGGRISPANFLTSLNTGTGVSVKFMVPYPSSIWRHPTKFQRTPSGSFWDNGVLATPCLAVRGRNTENVQRASKTFGFEEERKQKRWKVQHYSTKKKTHIEDEACILSHFLFGEDSLDDQKEDLYNLWRTTERKRKTLWYQPYWS